jgi:hypothetical protein
MTPRISERLPFEIPEPFIIRQISRDPSRLLFYLTHKYEWVRQTARCYVEAERIGKLKELVDRAWSSRYVIQIPGL